MNIFRRGLFVCQFTWLFFVFLVMFVTKCDVADGWLLVVVSWLSWGQVFG